MTPLAAMRAPAPAFIALALAASLAASPAAAALFGTLFAGSPPATLGVRDGRLAPCPDRPNCVASHDGDAGRRIAPLEFRGDPEAAMTALVATIRAMPRATVVVVTPEYVHAQFASATMGFVDDAEFLLVPADRKIEVRSAARLGYSDLGVNRERIEAIRAALAAHQP